MIVRSYPRAIGNIRNQALQLSQYLTKKGHEIHYLANAFAGMTLSKATIYDGTELNFKIYGELQHTYFKDSMSDILKEIMADRFIILLDTFMLHGPDGWFLNVDTSPARTLFWFPTDGGGGLPAGCQNILKKIDKPVAMSKFGQKQIKEYHDLNVDYIPHGLDTKLFYKMKDEEKLKLREKYGLVDKFVIGIVARNQPRKHLDRTLKTMRLVADKIPNAVLFFHLDAEDAAQPLWKIKSLIMKFGLENRCIFSGMKAHKGIPDKEMKNIYNVMDVFFLSTSGEGFGIPIIEAMACEVPVVATSYTTTPELVEKHKAGFGVKLSGVENVDLFSLHSKDYDFKTMNGVITGSWEVERAIIDVNDAADKIIRLYNDPKLMQVMGQNGRRAVMEEYDFETKIGPQWEKLLK